MILLDTINYLFWWTVFRVFQLVRYILLIPVPNSLVKKRICTVFRQYKIKVTTDGEKADDPCKDYKCEIVVHNPKFFKLVANDDIMAIGESYMDGWWDSNDVAELISCLLKKPPALHQRLADKTLLATNQQTRTLSLRVAEEHYNLGNDFFTAMLDPTMNYTCGYWKDDTKTLEQAQINKMDLIARKLKLKPGMKVLDIGCGFGATAKYLAQKYKVSVVGYNISKEQVAYARESCKGLDVTFVMEDYRNATGQFDGVYSIGFWEAIGTKNYHEYFEVCDRCLKDDGLMLIHSISIADHQTRTSRWLCKYIFPGGELPFAADFFLPSNKGNFVVEDLHSFAKSYAKTLRCWQKNFNAKWDGELEAKYGGYFDDRFYRTWNFYLSFCTAPFEERTCQLLQVVYSKHGRKEEYMSVR